MSIILNNTKLTGEESEVLHKAILAAGYTKEELEKLDEGNLTAFIDKCLGQDCMYKTEDISRAIVEKFGSERKEREPDRVLQGKISCFGCDSSDCSRNWYELEPNRVSEILEEIGEGKPVTIKLWIGGDKDDHN